MFRKALRPAERLLSSSPFREVLPAENRSAPGRNHKTGSEKLKAENKKQNIIPRPSVFGMPEGAFCVGMGFPKAERRNPEGLYSVFPGPRFAGSRLWSSRFRGFVFPVPRIFFYDFFSRFCGGCCLAKGGEME